MMSVRKVMSPEFMAGNCLAALQAHGLAAREETRRCEGRAECNSNGQIHININDPQVACIWLDTTLLEHRHASTCDILLWASVCKAWRFHIFARQPQTLSPVQEPAFRRKRRRRKGDVASPSGGLLLSTFFPRQNMIAES